MIQASVQASPQITASLSGAGISAAVSGGGISAAVSGGPSSVTAISSATDVATADTTDGDVLRYSSGKWRNYPEANLVDGGNW